jgi:hypothetical protein
VITTVGPAVAWEHFNRGWNSWSGYSSFVSESLLGSGAIVRTTSCSVTGTALEDGSSTTWVMISATDAAVVCSDGRLSAFLAFLSAVFGNCFFLAVDFWVIWVFLRTLRFAFFGAARFVTFPRAGVACPFRRFELLLATRLLALAMAASREIGDLSLCRPRARVSRARIRSERRVELLAGPDFREPRFGDDAAWSELPDQVTASSNADSARPTKIIDQSPASRPKNRAAVMARGAAPVATPEFAKATEAVFRLTTFIPLLPDTQSDAARDTR